MFIAKKLIACLHEGGGPEVGEVTSALFNVQTVFAKIVALFSAVSKLNEISRKSVPENGSEIENRKSSNIRKF